MPIERVSSVYRASNQPKGFNSCHKSKRVKITELGINKPKVKRENKIRRKPLSPWLIIGGFIVGVCLFNWFVETVAPLIKILIIG
jgi:hypothetical protein